MWFADFDGSWKYFYHDCDEATARWAFERLGPERFGDTTVQRPGNIRVRQRTDRNRDRQIAQVAVGIKIACRSPFDGRMIPAICERPRSSINSPSMR